MLRLELDKISVSFGSKHVLTDICARFDGGSVNSIIGVNGIGKSVLMKSIAGLIRHTGTVRLTDGAQTCGEESIAYVPQMEHAASALTALEIVLLGKVRSLRWRVRNEDIAEVEDVMKKLKVLHLKEQLFSQLSGGQKQMVTMAQALIAKPKLLLLDEPTSALDLYHQLALLEVTRDYCRENGAISLVVMHDLSLVSRFSDEILLLKDGSSAIQGTAQDILRADLLEPVYGVKLETVRSKSGYTMVLPLEIARTAARTEESVFPR